MKKDEDIIEDFDFGFSFSNESEKSNEKINLLMSEKSHLETTAEEYLRRLNLLYNAIIPFLDNLCIEPEKATIHWPNRVDKIQEYKQKLKNILEGNI